MPPYLVIGIHLIFMKIMPGTKKGLSEKSTQVSKTYQNSCQDFGDVPDDDSFSRSLSRPCKSFIPAFGPKLLQNKSVVKIELVFLDHLAALSQVLKLVVLDFVEIQICRNQNFCQGATQESSDLM
jgi:hypothetical protein